MNDRELLEFAAKAVGRIVGTDDQCDPIDRKYTDVLGLWCVGPWAGWFNPLNDEGQRYRLAQKLRISIDYEDCCAWTRKHGDLIQEFCGGECPDEAHVIVGVAAEIGRRMP